MRRGLAIGAVAVAAVLGWSGPASARIAQGACTAKALKGAECGTFPVPLDHANPSGRQLSIAYALFPARRSSKGTVAVVPGGPGEEAIPLAASVAKGALSVLRDDYDLVFADPRGTGKSAPLTCTAAPKGVFKREPKPATVRACGEQLGDARRFFTTYDEVRDLDALRTFLEVPKLIPVGVSYGGEVANAYARWFPDRVQALVLDSTSPIEGADTLGRLPQLALPRVLSDVCFPPGCRQLLGNPLGLLDRAVARMRGRGLAGHLVLPDGKRKPVVVTLKDLYEAIRASDADPTVRSALPSVIQAASRGDAAPLIRLLANSGGGSSAPAQGVNEVRFLATTCQGGQLPWAPDSDPATREGTLLAAMRERAAAYAPFPVGTLAGEVPAAECLGWPATPAPPFVPNAGAGPDVPVLVLAGRLDLRTPLEDQRRAAAQFPSATVVAVPEVGHSVLVNDRSNCARVTLRAFLSGKAVGPCTKRAKPFPLALPAVRRLRDIPAGSAAGDAPARVKRTLVAIDLTLRDVERSLQATPGAVGFAKEGVRVGGLRGGHLVLSPTSKRIRLDRYSAVEGVALTGSISLQGEGAFTITGRGATGTVTTPAGKDVLEGTLDGVVVKYRAIRIPGTL